LDADACVLLGKICQNRGDPEQAVAYFDEVLINHPDAKVAPSARLGRGVSRIMLKQDDAGLTDLHDLVDEIATKQTRARFRGVAMRCGRGSTCTIAPPTSPAPSPPWNCSSQSGPMIRWPLMLCFDSAAPIKPRGCSTRRSRRSRKISSAIRNPWPRANPRCHW